MFTDELVMTVPRNLLFDELSPPQGFFTQNTGDILGKILKNYKFMPRRKAENDPAFKQPIPYAVVTHEGRIFMLKRLSTQDEKRLHNKMSIGVGGHVNPVPQRAGNIVEKALRRELAEELFIPANYGVRLVGFINDDSNPVGSVHLGIVYHVDTLSPAVSVREKDLMEGSFCRPEEVIFERDRMESWSALLIDNLDSFMPWVARRTA